MKNLFQRVLIPNALTLLWKAGSVKSDLINSEFLDHKFLFNQARIPQFTIEKGKKRAEPPIYFSSLRNKNDIVCISLFNSNMTGTKYRQQ